MSETVSFIMPFINSYATLSTVLILNWLKHIELVFTLKVDVIRVLSRTAVYVDGI